MLWIVVFPASVKTFILSVYIKQIMKIILLLPLQNTKYSILYNIYRDIYEAILEMGIPIKIVEIKLTGTIRYPYGDTEFIDKTEIVNLEMLDDTYIVTVDDHGLIRYLSGVRPIKNLLIWATYFYGAKFLFQSYRNRDYSNEHSLKPLSFVKIYGIIPQSVGLRISKFYSKTLKLYPVVSQSVWAGLLLERVYSIRTLGILRIPVDPEIYEVSLNAVREGILVFLGNNEETDLLSLFNVINIIKISQKNIKLDYFGDSQSGKTFQERYGIRMNYLGKIERKELSIQYSTHVATIAPIYNGNFEMVPIESLLCGTPVISFLQPFLEVLGESFLVANINNLNEIERKTKSWFLLDVKQREVEKNKILDQMNNKIIARQLIEYLHDL
jgi:hypothetical protein